MNSPISPNTDLSTIESLVKASDLTLKENQVVQIHVLDKLSEKKFVLFFNGNSFFADSNLALEKGQTLLAKVKALEPSLIFSLIDFNKDSKINTIDNIFKQTLSEINIIPSEKNINAAKAFSEELIPLKQELLNSFLNKINKLNIESFDNIKNAVKLFKLNIPIEPENIQQFKEIFSVNTSETAKSIDSLIKNLESLKNEMQVSEYSELQKSIPILKNFLSNIIFKDSADADLIFSNIQKTVAFSAESYEKQIISSLSEVFLNSNKYLEKVPEMLKMLEETITNIANSTPNMTKTNIDNSSTFTMLYELKNNLINISEKLQTFTPETEIFPSIAKQIVNIIQILNESSSLKNINSDNIFQNPKTQILFENFVSKFKSEMSNLFDSEKIQSLKNLFENSDKTFEGQEYVRIKNLLNTNNTTNYLQIMKNSINLKEELFSLKEKFNNIFENSNLSEKAKNVSHDTETIINQIYKQQFQNLSNTINNDFSQLNLIYMNQNEQTNELPLFFKKQKLSKGKGLYDEFFSILFSMELSNLKHFEINILDQDQNIDITFSSQDSKINAFFQENSQTLLDSIKKHVNKKISINSTTQKKGSRTPLNINDKNFKNTNHLIDIIM